MLRFSGPADQDANVPLLDTYDPEKVKNREVMMMEPYVCGYALPLSALDSILIAVSSTVFRLLQNKGVEDFPFNLML